MSSSHEITKFIFSIGRFVILPLVLSKKFHLLFITISSIDTSISFVFVVNSHINNWWIESLYPALVFKLMIEPLLAWIFPNDSFSNPIYFHLFIADPLVLYISVPTFLAHIFIFIRINSLSFHFQILSPFCYSLYSSSDKFCSLVYLLNHPIKGIITLGWCGCLQPLMVKWMSLVTYHNNISPYLKKVACRITEVILVITTFLFIPGEVHWFYCRGATASRRSREVRARKAACAC